MSPKKEAREMLGMRAKFQQNRRVGAWEAAGLSRLRHLRYLKRLWPA